MSQLDDFIEGMKYIERHDDPTVGYIMELARAAKAEIAEIEHMYREDMNLIAGALENAKLLVRKKGPNERSKTTKST